MLARDKRAQKRKNEKSLKNKSLQVSQTTTHKTNPMNQKSSSKVFDDIYLDTKNPASYSSSVKSFMNQKTSISLHKRRIRNFKRRKIIVPGPYHSISCDLIDYSMYARQNNGYKYILCCVDMFSRFSYAKPLRNKTAEAVAKELDSIISSMQFVPKFFTSDKGGEFDLRNQYIKNILVEKYHMVVYYTTGPKKNSMVERYNRTIKERIERYFTETGKKKWVDILADFVSNINHSINRSIGIPPIEVTFENAPKIWAKLYPNAGKNPKCDLILVNDRVRIALAQNIFYKGYHQAWSDEIYTVVRIEKSMGICLYNLKNDNDEILPRKFYISELNFVSRNVS